MAFQPNLDFYMNKCPAEPDGDTIENILLNWKGNYEKLEENISYIQWLFPNKSQGKNPASYPLTEAEAEIIRQDPELNSRVKRAFEMMLDFFGMELCNYNQFKLADNADERLEHINEWGSESFVKINRILLSLKELGLEYLMLPWIRFLAKLVYKEKTLDKAEQSLQEYWIETLSKSDYDEIKDELDEYQE